MTARQRGRNTPETGSNKAQTDALRRPFEPELLAAGISGWSAFVVDRILTAHLKRFRPALTSDQWAELEQTRRAIHTAAAVWVDSTSAGGSAEALPAEIESPSSSDLLSVADVADVLQLSDRRVRQLAERWAAAGLARKVGRAWLIDRGALNLADPPTAA